MISQDKYLGWIFLNDQKPIASAGLMIMDWPPHPLDPDGESRAYILNVFVEPDFRRRGLARELLRLCLAEARRRTCASSRCTPPTKAAGFMNRSAFEAPTKCS